MDTMTVPLSEVFFPSVVVCNINQVRKSFFEELGIYDNETFIRQIYYDYIEGKSKAKHHTDSSSGDYDEGQPEKKIALHEKILREYLERMNKTTEGEASINWITHQKCQDMHILSKVRVDIDFRLILGLGRGVILGLFDIASLLVLGACFSAQKPS